MWDKGNHNPHHPLQPRVPSRAHPHPTSPSPPPQGRMWIYWQSKLVFPSDSSDSDPRYGGDWGGTGWTVLQGGFLPPKNSTSCESEISWSKLLTGLKELGLCGWAEGRKRRGIPTSHRESLFRWRCQTSGQTGLCGPGSPLGRPGKSWPWWASTPTLCRTSQDLESLVKSSVLSVILHFLPETIRQILCLSIHTLQLKKMLSLTCTHYYT